MSAAPGFLARTHQRVMTLARDTLKEHASPGRLGLAVAVGAFVGSSPLLGLHAVVALAIASLARLNRVAAFAGSNVTIGPLMPLVVAAEMFVGGKLSGQPSPATPSLGLGAALSTLGLSWWLGWLVVGTLLASILGTLTWVFARRRQRREMPP